MYGADDAAPCSHVRTIEVRRSSGEASCGFHLSRSKWDPYPWVSRVEEGSPADEAGVRPGDCVLELNGEDIVGRRICDVAELVRSAEPLELLLWNAGVDPDCTPEALCCGPMPLNMQRLSACMTSVIAYLECPVCFATICPPACQCVNGHLLCIKCHAKSERCPVCRVKLSRGRCLFADQVFNSLVESFGLNKKDNNQQMSDKIKQMFKQKSKWKDLPVIKVSQPKFLQNLLIDRALSAENLSSNGWRQTAASRSSDARVARAYLDEPQLKTKSLSACDISGGRHGAELQASRSAERLAAAGATEGATEGACHCPFSAGCRVRPAAPQLADHFRRAHSDGPLVQYFTAAATFKLLDSHHSTYHFLLAGSSFFLKILAPPAEQQNALGASPNNGLLIWMWYVGDSRLLHEYHVDLSIKLEDSAASLINVSGALFSLEKWSWDTIQKGHKGSFISMDAIKALAGNCNSRLNLEINIRHSIEFE